MIPGSEHAPTIAVGYVTEQGGFHTSIEDIPKIRRVDSGELIPDAYIEARRQLTVTDPDDQRVIWRLAALTFGLSEDEACGVLLCPQWTLADDGCYQWLDEWILCQPATHTDKWAPLPRFWRLDAVDDAPTLRAPDVAHATAALCAAVWGPKQATP